MSSKLMTNGKWFDKMNTNTMSFGDIVDFVRSHEAIGEGGRFHKPMKHSDLLAEFHNRAEKVGMKLVDTQVALSRDGMKIMCVSNTEADKNNEYGLSLGFRNSTNSTQSFSGAMGSNVWICSNGCIAGLIIPSKQRNTINNYDRFGDKIDIIFDRFNTNKEGIKGQLEMMKNTKINDDIIGKFVKALIADGSIGNTHICNIIREMDNPTVNKKSDDSCFRLLNAGTWVSTHEIKNPMQGMMASRTINNTLLKIIDRGFQPLGDDVVDAELIDVA
jgi:hypothetical protein